VEEVNLLLSLKDEIRERIKAIRNKSGLSMAKFGAVIGVSSGNVSDWESGKVLPNILAIAAISQNFGISIDWIITGKEFDFQDALPPDIKKLIEAFKHLGEDNQHALKAYTAFLLSCEPSDVLEQALNKLRTPETPPEPETIKEEQNKYFVPILGHAAAGLPILVEEFIDGVVPVPKDLFKEKAYFIRIKGDSMIQAGINDGSLVLIRPQPTVENNEIALVTYNTEVTVKRFVRENNCIRLRSANPEYKDIIIKNLEAVRILGKVIKIIPREEANQLTRPLFEQAQ
jgi:repressor LexA